MVLTKICNFDRAVHTGPLGCRYVDRLLPGGSAKNRPSTVDFGRRGSIEGEIDRGRSIEREKGKKKKKRKRRKKEKRRKKNLAPTHGPCSCIVAARWPPAPARRRCPRALFLLCGEKDRSDKQGSPFRSVPPGNGGMYRPDRIPVHRPPATGRYRASPHAGTKRCLAFPRRNEASPRLPVGEQGHASSSRMGKRHRLVFPHGEEASPRLLTGERGVVLPRGDEALFSREARRRFAPGTILYRDKLSMPVRTGMTNLAKK
ncbi:hypothetical protein GW17_00031324 [Ensete ventricosum]|nr:hypothetical protein GW17_00031324 [Ensete ventricosum]